MMWETIFRRAFPGMVVVAAVLLGVTADIWAVEEAAVSRVLDRSYLTESFRNTGQSGASDGEGAYQGRDANSMHYPYTYTGSQGGSYGRDNDNDNSNGQGFVCLARDVDGNRYITTAGPWSNSRDNQPLVADLTPGTGNIHLKNGEDHPLTKAKVGWNTKWANVWFNTDAPGFAEQLTPFSAEPVEISNFRENGQYNLPQFDNWPEEIIVTRWKSKIEVDPTGTGLTFTRYAYAWAHPDYDDFFIVEIVIENTSDRVFDEVYSGQLDFWSISKPGHSWRKWNGYWSYGSAQWPIEDDRLEFTESANYAGAYKGKQVVYQWDTDAPQSSDQDEGEAYNPGIAEGQYGFRASGELLSPQYLGWGPVDVVPPFMNDPEEYVPITGTNVGDADIPDGQPAYFHWWHRRGRLSLEFEPNEQINTLDEMWDKWMTPGKPYDDLPIEGGARPGERYQQNQLHGVLFGPWALKPGEKAKYVMVYAGGLGSESAGPGGEPMDFRWWSIQPSASGQLGNGLEALMNHVDRARQLYAMGYDVPNQPPDVASIERTDTSLPLKIFPNASGNAEMTWTDGADDAVNPDYNVADVEGYKVYVSVGLPQDDPVPHSGNEDGPWHLAADIKVKDPAYYSGGLYTWSDVNSVTGFPYWYTIAPYASGHNDWANTNAQTYAVAGGQQPVPTTLADLPGIVKKHVEDGISAKYHLAAAKHTTTGGGFTPRIAASDGFDALQSKVMVVPNPWKDDGTHSFGGFGDNNKNMRFTNIPRLARISIYTAAGDLVVTQVHDGTSGSGVHTGEMAWGQRTRSGTSWAAPGIFYFVVESLVPGSEGKLQRGTFLIIQ